MKPAGKECLTELSAIERRKTAKYLVTAQKAPWLVTSDGCRFQLSMSEELQFARAITPRRPKPRALDLGTRRAHQQYPGQEMDTVKREGGQLTTSAHPGAVATAASVSHQGMRDSLPRGICKLRAIGQQKKTSACTRKPRNQKQKKHTHNHHNTTCSRSHKVDQRAVLLAEF